MKIYIIKKNLHDKDILLDEGIHQRLLSILFYRKSNLNMKLLNLLLVVMSGVIALMFSFWKTSWINKQDQGSDKMKLIGKNIIYEIIFE